MTVPCTILSQHAEPVSLQQLPHEVNEWRTLNEDNPNMFHLQDKCLMTVGVKINLINNFKNIRKMRVSIQNYRIGYNRTV